MEAGAGVSDFVDEHTNPEARVLLHPTVIEWAENICKASRADKHAADVTADFDTLLAFARGEVP